LKNNNPEKSLILAVDDELLNLELLKFILEKNSFDYVGALNPDQAITAALEQKPDLILLDVMLPQMNGFELCQKIKSHPECADIPIIFITGKVNMEDKIKGFKVGGVDYVTKPFDEQELIARIQTHTDLIKAKSKVEKQALDLQDSNVLKDRMFSIIGHDLRSPLSSIKLKLDFIMRGIIDPKADNFLDDTVYDLLNTTDEAFSLLENLLGWAKSESGVLSFIPEQIDLKELVTRSLRLFELNLNTKMIVMETNIPEGITAYADMNMVKTVIRNLLSNAIKFTPKNGRIVIEVRKMEDVAIIAIKDNGVGIAAEDLDKVLNPNEHFSKTGTEKEAGSGLGLVLCQDFVHKNGGTLILDSELGAGSTFYFDLPLTGPNATV